MEERSTGRGDNSTHVGQEYNAGVLNLSMLLALGRIISAGCLLTLEFPDSYEIPFGGKSETWMQE